MYDYGRGVAKDRAQAAVWYRKAADQGDSSAELNLGALYANGEGVPRDYAQAVSWLARAAQKGDDTAARNLEVNLGRLPTLRMLTNSPVLASPEVNGSVVKTASIGELAYRLSQFDNWYEVYFREKNTVGYVAISQAAPVVSE
jgi:TPR repeat protein